MSRKITIGLAAIALLAAVGLIWAQEGARGQGGGRGQGPGMGPQSGPMGQWLDDLEKAYQDKNMDKIGELIGQMKERRQRFQGGPPEAMRGPGGPGGPAGPGGPFGPGGEGQGQFIKPSLAKGEVEKRILTVLNDMDSQRRGMMNVPAEGGRFLRLLAEAIGAKSVVEIGTSNGYSGIWQCLALKTTGGKLTTFEIDAQRAALARENFKKAGVDDIVTLVEGDAHQKVAEVAGPVDMAFVDADKEGYTDYLKQLLPKMRPGGLILAHNITQGMADPKFIEAITTNPDLETLFFSEGGGFSVTMKKHDMK
jgi:predicted O-methyltransferase YrrM